MEFDLKALQALKNSVNSAPELPENNRFNFGKYKGTPFEQAINKSGFKRWVDYIYSVDDDWNEKMARDMTNFERFLEDISENEDYQRLTTVKERLDYLFSDENEEEEILFWFGKYRKAPLNKVPMEYKLWWASSTLERHPLDDDFWNTHEGLKTYKLLIALNIPKVERK